MIKGKMQRLGEGSGWGCMECEYKTAFQTNLFSHIETHHCSGVAYTCPQCFSAHPSKNSLRMHIRRKHNSPPKTGHIISYQSWLFSIKKSIQLFHRWTNTSNVSPREGGRLALPYLWPHLANPTRYLSARGGKTCLNWRILLSFLWTILSQSQLP